MPEIRHYDLSGGEAVEFTPQTSTGFGTAGEPLDIPGELWLNGVKVNIDDYRPKTETMP